MAEIMEGISEEQGGLRMGKGCMDQIFTINGSTVQVMYTVFMDLEKAYDKDDKQALWNVLNIYGMEGNYWKELGIYREACACAMELGVR